MQINWNNKIKKKIIKLNFYWSWVCHIRRVVGRFFKADIVFSHLTYVLRSFHNILREDIDILQQKWILTLTVSEKFPSVSESMW